MRNPIPQLGCADGQMGHFYPQLGAVVYDVPNEGQLGGPMGDTDLISSLTSTLQNSLPGISNSLIGQFLQSTPQGQQLVQTGQQLGVQAAAAQAAQQTTALQTWYTSQLNSLKANYATYLQYALYAALFGAVGYFIVLPMMKKARRAAPATASNPRRRRRKSRR